MTTSHWSSRTAFIFAAAAAAVGLGNIWRFPYLAGQNGGGAFVLIYLFFVVTLGIPLMTSEVMLGRIGKKNPTASIRQVADDVGRSHHWQILGSVSVLAGFLIACYYVVISGWVLDYFMQSILGDVIPASHPLLTRFELLKINPWRTLLSDTLILGISTLIIRLDVQRGLERAVMWMFPAFLLILLVLLAWATSTTHFAQGAHFLFSPDFSRITPRVILEALGQAFFSLNIAMGVIILFSAYLPDNTPLVSSVLLVVFFDTAIAILAGLIIFPIVFMNHLQPSRGPGLIFETLPLAFSQMPAGHLIATLFFMLLLFAAFTSVIALLEVTTTWLGENYRIPRKKATLCVGTATWILSLGTIASFSHPSYVSLLGISFFKAIDFLTSGILLPLGGLFIAVFTGWLLPKKYIHDKLGWDVNRISFFIWRWVKRYFAPIAILLILLTSIGIF